ncbi:NUDIX hydrolase [Paenibacillus sp. FSL P4-0338]|uniref:NUDIX domain-containing protein n=1 Tax=unclassified Paenibacillus TaxID=185978 RepID=UPI0004B1DA6C|nr:NUDIX hydrolase [Paenibacillus sp. FSL R7-269]
MELRDGNGLTEQEFLEQYRPGDYVRPSVATDMVIFTAMDAEADHVTVAAAKELHLLLIRRGGHPCLGKWALPGGFAQPDETTDQAAARELEEETGVTGAYLEQLRTFSDPGRDPRTWVISSSYMALVDSRRIQLEAGDDAEAAAWFKVSYQLRQEHKELLEPGCIRTRTYELRLEAAGQALTAVIEQTVTAAPASSSVQYAVLSNDGLAFDHARIIAYAMERLRQETERTGIALLLMPEQFTLAEFQQVYELIIGQELPKAVFLDKMAALITATNLYTEQTEHTPSRRLYQRNWGEVWIFN